MGTSKTSLRRGWVYAKRAELENISSNDINISMKRLNYINIIWETQCSAFWQRICHLKRLFFLCSWRTQQKYDHPSCRFLEWVWQWWRRLGNPAVTSVGRHLMDSHRDQSKSQHSVVIPRSHTVRITLACKENNNMHIHCTSYTQSLVCSSWTDFCKLFWDIFL